MSHQKKLPTRRDRREAIGYLEDLLNSFTPADGTTAELAELILDAAIEIKVQRATDRLVLYFDLEETPGEGALPEATDDGQQEERAAEGRPRPLRPVDDNPQA
jgi:hypothetical protein